MSSRYHSAGGARAHRLQVLRTADATHSQRFDRVARTARRVFDVPMALVRLIPHAREVGPAFDTYALDTDGVFVVEDTTKDARFVEDPIVAGPPHVRFLAACVIRTRDGAVLGTLSILDREPRPFSEANQAALGRLADGFADELVDLEASALDPTTGLLNRDGFQAFAGQWREHAKTTKEPLSWLFLTLDTATEAEATTDIARALQEATREQDVLGRLRPHELAVLMPNASATTAERVSLAIHEALVALDTEKPYSVKFRLGHVTLDGQTPDDVVSAHAMLARASDRSVVNDRR